MKNLRLNLYLAQAGLCSRRASDELIKSGQITINHAVVKNIGYRVLDKDTVRYKKQVVKLIGNELITLIINKPTGFITTVSDDQDRPTVMDLLDKKIRARVYPIGRLDRNTTGVLLMTNDGDLAMKLAHPKYEIQKVYHVTLAKELTDEHLEKIRKGLHLKDGPIKVDGITRGLQKNRIKVTIHSGKNKIVRRIFESQGYTVRKLDRLSFANLSKRALPIGKYRILTEKEIERLKKKATL